MGKILTKLYSDVDDVDVDEIDGDAITDGNSSLMEDIEDGANEIGNFGGDEWIQEGLLEKIDASLNSSQHHHLRLPDDQNSPLQIPPSATKNFITSSQNDEEAPQQDTDQMRLQAPKEIHTQHMMVTQPLTIDGFQKIQRVDGITAINDLFQQQQQQLQQQLQQQQLKLQQLKLQQQLQQRQNYQAYPLQIPPASLNQSATIHLQVLQYQQRQILNALSSSGLVVDTNCLINPFGTLLNTLDGQISGNNNSIISDTSNNSINMNSNNINTMNRVLNYGPNNTGAPAWGQIGGSQQLQQTKNSLQNPAGIIPAVSSQRPQHNPQQQQHQDFAAGASNASIQPPQPLVQLHHTKRNQPPKRFVPNNIPQQQQQQVVVTQPPQPLVQLQHMKNEPPKRFVSNNGLKMTDIDRTSSPNKTSKIICKAKHEKRKSISFPMQLWDAMMENGPFNDIAFEWLPDGKSFVVVDSQFFCMEILNRRFKQSKYGSFVRKLHRWGFIRLTSGTGTDCFHHPLFQRTRSDLVAKIKCNSRKEKDGKEDHSTFSRLKVQNSVQPSLMGVEKFIRTKVVSTKTVSVPV